MPFGLRNAAQTFQRFIDQVLRGLTFTFAYLDDILVASKDADEHEQQLNILFKRLADVGVILPPEKCTFGVSQIEILGHILDEQGIRPSPAKVREIKNFPMPKTLQQLHRFLGMFNFYGRFVPHTADLFSK